MYKAENPPDSQRNIIALHFHYGLSQLMLYPVVCARTFQSARCELLVPNQHSRFSAEHHSITFSLWAVAAYALPSGVCADLSVGAV